MPGLFSCCFGGEQQPSNEDYALLAPAPLPAETGGRWTPGAPAGRAPAFGEGALRQDEWAPRRTQAAGGHAMFINTAAPPSLQPQPAPYPSPPAARTERAGWDAEPAYVREQAATAAAANGGKGKAGWSLPGRGRSRSPSNEDSRDEAAGGFVTSTSYQPVDIFWHSSYEPVKPTAAKPAKARGRSTTKQRQKQDPLLGQAPAFGQGALTKWH